MMRTLLTIALFCTATIYAQDAMIRIDLSRPLRESRFRIGVTHTHGYWERGDSAAVQRAHALLVEGITFQNQHIMGWGAGNPEPASGEFAWTDLDHRVELMRSIDTPMIITFCTAPGWMKETDDWAMEEEVSDTHIEDFAELCAAVAGRYSDVEYFQIWNEMKGYWNSALDNWDYVRYTTLYNAVYAAVKSVRPDAKLGGPYLVIQGDGGEALGKRGRDTFSPIGARDWTVIDYWLEHKTGADFFCFDYGLVDYHDVNTYTQAEKMRLTGQFGRVIAQLAEKTDLPIFVSEFYAGMDPEDPQFTAANHASCYYHSVLNGASLGLVWNPQEGEIDNHLFAKTDRPDGGRPSPHYEVVSAINRYFSSGTMLYETTSSTDQVEVLASAEKTMLINKSPGDISVAVNGDALSLARYEVKIIDTPDTPPVE